MDSASRGEGLAHVNNDANNGVELAFVDILNLVDHPLQVDYFDCPTEIELEELAHALFHQRQRVPIDVAADRVTVICGHARVQAARRLGWAKIQARVHPFAADDPRALQLFFGDNLNRKQLDILAVGRAYAGLLEAEWALSKRSKQPFKSSRYELRERLSKQFGLSKRQLDRYVRLASLPAPVHHKIRARMLTANDAEKLFELDQDKLTQVVSELAQAADKRSCKAVIRAHCRSQGKQPSYSAKAAAKSLISRSEQIVLDLKHYRRLPFTQTQRQRVIALKQLLEESLSTGGV